MGAKILILLVAFFHAAPTFSANIPDHYIGEWEINVVTQVGFPWWKQIKHPVTMKLTKSGGTIVDQFGFRCKLERYFYDPEIDKFIFSHCGEGKKSKKAFDVVHLVGSENGNLLAEVMTYKLLFKWKGKKINQSKSTVLD